MPGVTYGGELFGPLLVRAELLTQPLRPADGCLHLLDGPGRGVGFDPAAVAPVQEELRMLFHVRMDVAVPRDLDPDERARLVTTEKARALELQRAGTWVHLWRVVGQYSNISVFDVSGTDELHEILWNLPLFPFMTITVTPLTEHPSALSANP
ncbi:muconolactone Delta-isomerase [Geodermatophilus chilensis]|uniref:muconolactone Delta-isomerase n=1 Tax=Geodermatophilus chilensis TaxID=2035835 RepID=UPI001E35C5A3|nr:muconolactone Delta-isomerase family protein [Geodermatophilus chilensis]